MKEEAVQFGQRGSLVGVVTRASQARQAMPAAILLNPGIVHRVGPGRIYVKIARSLAAMGVITLRFDFSGIGDSTVRLDNCRFEKSSVDEARAAMSFLQSTTGINRFILMGGCSGAAVSLETARLDQRVLGAVLINCPTRSDEEGPTGRRHSYYYWNCACLNVKSWWRLLTGQSDYRKIGRALVQGIKRKAKVSDRHTVSATDQQFRATLGELANRGVHPAFICSKGDVLLRDLREAGGDDLKTLCMQGKASCRVIPGSDHTFSSAHDQKRLVDAVLAHIHAMAPTAEQQVPDALILSRPVEALFHEP